MTFGGPTPSRGWIRHEGIAAWVKAAEQWDQIESRVDQAAIEATELHILAPMREAIRNDPSINGEDSESWNMANEVADALQVFQQDGEYRYGVPPNHPAAESAVQMEYGNELQPPSPHFRNSFINGSIDKAKSEFVKKITNA